MKLKFSSDIIISNEVYKETIYYITIINNNVIKEMKKLIFIFVLFLTIIVSGCITSPMDNVNNELAPLGESIKNGNSYYNTAVDFINSKNYSNSLSQAKLATVEFDKVLNTLLDIKSNYTEELSDIQSEYIDLLYSEVSLKNDANNNLITAIDYYNDGEDELGNEYASKSNDLMSQASDLKNSRDEFVLNNPNYFN